MPIEKSLRPPMLGDELADLPEPEIEIEVVPDDGLLTDETGALVLDIELGTATSAPEAFDANLAEFMADDELRSLAADVLADFDEDTASRKEWIQTYVDGVELLGLQIEERTEPWDGACGVYHPILAEALVKFQSETMMATFPASGPVRTKIIGKETPEKKEAAQRVQEDMNHQLVDVMREYRPEHERMLWGLGLSGNAFKKVYFDPSLGRQVSLFIPAEDIVVPYGASNLESAERITHVMRKTENELRKLQYAGFYRDVELGAPDNVVDEVEKKIAEKLGFRASSDDRYKILEIHTHLDLAGFEHEEDGEKTGIALPYVVTIEKGSSTVLAIRRNWQETDETYQPRQHFVHYGYVPGFGFYYFGLIHLIGAFAKSGTSLIRQLVDAGTLSNLPGGFKTTGMRVKGDDNPIGPGEWRDVDIPSGSLRDNMMPLPYKEPSQVLALLLDKIMEEGRRFANSADLQISDMSAQAPVGTTLAILERTLKNMSAIQARVHYSMKQELALLKEIIAAYAPDEYSYDPDVGNRFAKQNDYDNVDVIPVSDPNAATMAQKIVQMQAVFQMAQANPQIFNMPLLNRQMLEVMGIKDAEKLVPMPEDMKPLDPVSENQNVLTMKPVKAFLHQDHQSHITVHMSAMQDPKIQQLLGNTPQAQAMQQAMMAHITEHLGFEYRRQIEQQLGMPLPPAKDAAGDDTHMVPEVEARLSPLLAQAAQQLLAKNANEVQQQQAQQQAQQMAQDPLLQLQQQEMQLKMQDLQRKQAKDRSDVMLKMQQQDIERDRIAVQGGVAEAQLKADLLKSAVNTSQERNSLISKLGVDVLKHLSDKANDNANPRGNNG